MTAYYARVYTTIGGDTHTAAWMADSVQDYGSEYLLTDVVAVYCYPDEGRCSIVTHSSVVVHKTDDLHEIDKHEFRSFLSDVFIKIVKETVNIGGRWEDEQ